MNISYSDLLRCLGTAACLFLVACQGDSSSSSASQTALPLVFASVETAPVQSQEDAADDPAVWFNSRNPADSRILGTDKRFGLRVYDLAGEELQALDVGRINNVDIRRPPWKADYAAIAVGSNRTDKSLSFFSVSDTGEVAHLPAMETPTGLDDPYGICFFQGPPLYVFVNDKDGRYQQWRVRPGKPARLVRKFDAGGQPEGCVADDANGRLFYGVEEKGIYMIDAAANAEPRRTVIAEVDGTRVVADVEGMDLFMTGNSGYLVVSSQGNNSFLIYDRLPPYLFRGAFRVADNADGSVDGVSETDGLAVSNADFGESFPEGMLVVQDGFNTLPDAPQNFKLIDWRQVAQQIQEPVN